MEPVFMVLAEVAGVAAGMAIDQDAAVQGVDHLKINKKLTEDPLLDGSTPELIVDNLAKQVETTGNWNHLKAGHAYGPNAFYHDATNQAGAAVTFYAGNLKNGEYEVFSYYPVLANGADETAIQVFDGQVMHRKTVHKSRIKVVGQTFGEWVSLGTYRFTGNAKPFVRINSNQAGGITVADAILFKPVNSKQ
jgi:hypothetical protein